METGSSANFLSDQLLPPVRSTFLTVLCVLTFVASGYALLTSLPAVTGSKIFSGMQQQKPNPKMQAEQREALSKKDDKGSKFALKILDSVEDFMDVRKMKIKAGLDIFSALLCIGGALLMWRLKRNGYFIYLAGVVLWIAASVLVYGTGAFIAVMESGVKFFIGLIFIILYALNLKDLKEAKQAV